jgi:hypothetical protein
MRPIDDPSCLTPDERLSEVAGILAAGILRLHTRAALSGGVTRLAAAEKLAKSATPSLEVPDKTVLSVHNG